MSARAPEGYDPSKYPPFALTADLVITTVIDGKFSVALIRRGEDPYAGRWALPGGFVGAGTEGSPGESAEDAALRELSEETGLDLVDGGHLEQLRTYSEPGRDPRMRVVSVAFVAFVPYPGPLRAGSDACDAAWVDVDEALGRRLAFDHNTILRDAVERVRSKLEYTTLATAFVGEPFTLAELRRVYEAVWGVELHAANFARKVQSCEGFVEETGEVRRGSAGRSARLFRHAGAQLVLPPLMRPEVGT